MKEAPKHIFFLGAGGIGMSALALYFLDNNHQVLGYDRQASSITNMLENRGAKLIFEDNPMILPGTVKDADKMWIVYTPAITQESELYRWAKDSGHPMLKRSEVLGMISRQFKTIAVAGTHGKTTTSTLLAHIMIEAGLQPYAFLGGLSANYQSNYIRGKQHGWMVVEADEYDRSFLQLNPQHAIITSIDADHLDIYGNKETVKEGYQAFAKLVNNTIVAENKVSKKIKADKILTYAVEDEQANFSATALKADILQPSFIFTKKNEFCTSITLGIPGAHNIENALAAAAISYEIGLSVNDISKALATFKGVKRRFEILINKPELIYIDDYAHHPAEINAFLQSVKKLRPEKKITAIFQPHLFSRTRDFLEDFANSLSVVDDLILLEIYPAREMPIAGINSAALLKLCRAASKHLLDKHNLLKYIQNRKPEVLVTMGAGDIDQYVEPIKNLLA